MRLLALALSILAVLHYQKLFPFFLVWGIAFLTAEGRLSQHDQAIAKRYEIIGAIAMLIAVISFLVESFILPRL